MAYDFEATHHEEWSPARRLFAVTPDDDADLAEVARALWIGVGGNVELIAYGDTAAVVLVNVPSGSVLPIATTRVLAGDTTASSIVALV